MGAVKSVRPSRERAQLSVESFGASVWLSFSLKKASSADVNSTASLRIWLTIISFEDDEASPFAGCGDTFEVAAAIAACAAARSATSAR